MRDYDDYDYDDDDVRGRRKRVAIISIGLSCVVLLLFVAVPILTDDSSNTPSTDEATALVAGADTLADESSDEPSAAPETTATDDADDAAATATEPADESPSADSEAPSTTVEEAADEPDDAAEGDESSDTAGTTDDESDSGDADDEETAEDATDGSEATSDDESADATDDSVPALAVNELSYPTLPDGSPVPVLGIYDGDTVALSGVVPTEEAKQLLETLALANSKSPNATLVNFVTIDPTIPDSVGVRVVEKNSVRFPDGSAAITSAHAEELDRAVSILNALPHVTVLVIGHADQRGSAETNYRISDDRAGAVANYLVDNGISPLRVSSRPVGEADLLTLNTDPESLALNRRTEFVFYGLLAPPPAAPVEPDASEDS